MSPIVIEWLDIILRWLHVTAAVVWIGGSFYFIRLDYGLKRRENLPEGVKGDLWAVHGGGFYHMMKYVVAPARLPEDLKWTRWESYITFVSGFALLIVVYYFDAELFLIDRSVFELTAFQAGALSLASLVLAWLGYEALCRSPLGRHDVALALVGFVFFVALTFGFTQLFSGRGALNQIGAIIGTIMVANAFGVIHPNQRRAIVALKEGRKPNPERSRAAGQRSIHNNYLALPVLFLMISNHYPQVYATRYNWVIVAIVIALGPIIRHFFNRRHAGQGSAWWVWGVVTTSAVVIAWLTTLGPRENIDTASMPVPAFEEIESIVSSRCSMCHAVEPLWPSIAMAPAGVRLDQTDLIHANARLIGRSVVRTNSMPPGNVTGMTREEREIVAAWLAAGTPKE